MARCHYSNERGFSVENIDAGTGGTIAFFDVYVDDYLDDLLSEEYAELDEDSKLLLGDEISQKLNETISRSRRGFSEEEWNCFLSEGFLGVLKMRYPEIQQNEVFNFYVKVNKTIQDLEVKFQGKPYSEVLAEIQIHLDNKDAEDYNIWQAIHLNYDENFNWVTNKETGEGGRRKEYINFLEMQSKEKNTNTKQEYIDSQINLLLGEWQCKSLREFFDSYGLEGLKDINDLMKFCSVEATDDYKPIGNGSPLDAVMDLYFKLKPYFEKEHTAEEIGDGVRDTVTQEAMQEALASMTRIDEQQEQGNDAIEQ